MTSLNFLKRESTRPKSYLRFPLLLLAALPLAAYPLSLSDYLNQSTVTSSGDQFETVLTNNDSEVQIIPNAELIVVKQVTNDNGGDLVLGDFNVSSDAGVLTFDAGTTVGSTTTYTSTTLYLPPGTYSLVEDDVDGYTEGTWSCTEGLLNNAAFDSGELTLAFGEQTVCTIINDDVAPTLTLTKTLVNDDGGDLTIADFDIAIDGTEVTSGVANTVASNTSINISELDVDGYTEGTWSCTDSTGLTPAADLPSAGLATGSSMTLEPGSAVTCAITNNDIAPTLTLTKTLVNDNGGDLTIDDFDIAIDGTEVTSGAANTVQSNTVIAISELDIGGYTEGTWSCSDSTGLTAAADLPSAGVATGSSMTLEPGSEVTCAITNDDIAPTLMLTKTLVNDNGGTLTIADFDIAIDGTEVTSGVTYTQVANTAISISELDVDGYTEGTWSCSDSAGLTAAADLPSAGLATGSSMTLEPGSVVSCEITNDDIAPTLTLTKTLVNDNGGDLTIADFDIAIDGVEVTSGVANSVASNAVIAISELDMDGYIEGTWSCSDSTGLTPAADLPSAGLATGSSMTLNPGSDVTCEITNNDVAPTLTLTKTLINDNGGDPTIGDFDISVDGVEVTSGVANTVLANGAITIGELDVDGYTEGTWSCTDSTGLTLAADLPSAGVATGSSLTLEPGSIVTCEITNNDIEPGLVLSKTVINDNGGDLTVADFDISIDGVEVVNNANNPVSSNTLITISELDVPGYTEGTWSCTDANGLTMAADLPSAGPAGGATFMLEPGSAVTCEITNDDVAPTLTLTKTLVNDNGGDLTIGDFDIAIDGVEVTSGAANTVSANTAIAISELDINGYTEGTWSCSDSAGLTAAADLPTAGLATASSVTLEPGSTVTCAITNNDIPPTLTLNKTVVNDNGGDLTIADFDISIDGTEVTNGVANAVTSNTAIAISELDVAGYTEGTWSCADSTGLTPSADLPSAGVATGSSMTLEPGSKVTCAITNNDVAPTLTLTKTLVNDDGGDLTIGDFDISIDGVEVTSGVANAVASNATITISELDVDGYTEGTWACTDSTGLTLAADLPSAGVATGSTMTLEPGSAVTCEITNDDVAPKLTLTKIVVNDNGGTMTIADFDISIDGTEVSSGVANTVSSNTAILISELDLVPYAEGTWSCSDNAGLTAAADLPTAGSATGSTLTLEPGSDVVCEITNNDLGIDLSIVKVVDDYTPNIGQTITFSLTVENSGPDVATNATVNDVVPAGFTYVAGSIAGGSTSDDTDPTGAGLDWTIASMPVGVPFVLTFDAVVNAP